MRSLFCRDGRNQARDEQRQMVLGGNRLSVRLGLHCVAVYLSTRNFIYRVFWVWNSRRASFDGGIFVYVVPEKARLIWERLWLLWFYLGLLRRLYLKFAATGKRTKPREHAPDAPAAAEPAMPVKNCTSAPPSKSCCLYTARIGLLCCRRKYRLKVQALLCPASR